MSHPNPSHDPENELPEDQPDVELCDLCGGERPNDCLCVKEAQAELVGEALFEDGRGN